MLENINVILASASPRRTELLTQAEIKHQIIVSDCEEHATTDVPEEYVMELAGIKAEDVFQKYDREHSSEDFLVIGSDTVVAAEGKILGKPKSDEEAFEMISMLQANTHQVYTGVAVVSHIGGEKRVNVFYERSDVEVYPMSKEEIEAYIATGDCRDKAGSYGIQGRFAVHVKGIHGDYNSIVGLPIARLYQELKEI